MRSSVDFITNTSGFSFRYTQRLRNRIRSGIATPLREHWDTLSQGREQPAYKAKTLGFDRYVEPEKCEQFHDQEADGVYLTTVTVVKFATAV